MCCLPLLLNCWQVVAGSWNAFMPVSVSSPGCRDSGNLCCSCATSTAASSRTALDSRCSSLCNDALLTRGCGGTYRPASSAGRRRRRSARARAAHGSGRPQRSHGSCSSSARCSCGGGSACGSCGRRWRRQERDGNAGCPGDWTSRAAVARLRAITLAHLLAAPPCQQLCRPQLLPVQRQQHRAVGCVFRSSSSGD